MNQERRTWDILVIGGINTDYISRGNVLPGAGQTLPADCFYTGPGGKGGNQAVAASRLGAKVAFVGCVGQDARGEELIRSLDSEGVNTEFVARTARGPTGAAVIMVNGEGEKQIHVALGANHLLPLKHLRAIRHVIENCKVLLTQFETPLDIVIEAARLAKQFGVQVVLDPAPSTSFPKALYQTVDVLRPNADETEFLTGIKPVNVVTARMAASMLLRRGPACVSVPAGNLGDFVLWRNGEVFIPRTKVETIDATGAGDAYVAAFSLGIAEGMGWEASGRFANVAAALSTTALGAQAGLPSRKAVSKLLRTSRRA